MRPWFITLVLTLVLWALMPRHAESAPRAKRACAQAAQKLLTTQATGTSVWDEPQPIEVARGADGKPRLLAFSIDSELTWREVLELLDQYPAEKKLFDRLTRRTGAELELSPLLRRLEMSEAQFRAFALKRAARAKRPPFHLRDLNTGYQARVLKDFGQFAKARQQAAQSLQTILTAQDYPVSVGLDNTDLEIRHASFEQSPDWFAAFVRRLHAEPGLDPQTHLHLGVPAEVPKEKALAVAQAIEAQMTLTLVQKAPLDGEELHFDMSTLWPAYTAGLRGVVKFEDLAFATPVPSHDIEIRQWLNIEHGLALAQLGARMLKDVARIRVLSGDFNGPSHARFGNVFGALKFVAAHLRADASGKNHESAQALDALADEGVALGHEPVPDELLIKVREYLGTLDLESILGAEAFLTPVETAH